MKKTIQFAALQFVALVAFLLILLASRSLPAQSIPSGYVDTTATVAPLANGTYGAAWTNLSSSPQLALLGCQSTFQQTVNGTFDSYGHFSVLLADTSQICPSPSTWTFTLAFACPVGKPPSAFQIQVPVTGGGGTEDISAQIIAALPAQTCGGGGGGSSLPSPPAYSVQIANSTLTGVTSDPNITINPTTHALTVPLIATTSTNPTVGANPYLQNSVSFPYYGVWNGPGSATQYPAQVINGRNATWYEAGHDTAQPPVGPLGWTLNFPGTDNFTNRSQAQFQHQTTYSFNYGIGDASGIGYYDTFDWGGAYAPSDEGLYVGSAASGGEDNNVCTTTIQAGGGGTGATVLATNAASTCMTANDNLPALGDGHMILDLSRPIASGTITGPPSPVTGLTPEIYTLTVTGGAVTTSTAWGTLDGACSPSSSIVLNGAQTVSVTCSVTITSGAFTAGGVVSFAGQFHEQSVITSVGTPSGGVQSITLPLRHGHQTGSWIMQGGTQGMFVLTGNISDGLKYPVTCLGATSSTTVVVAAWGGGSLASTYTGAVAGGRFLGVSQAFTIYPGAEVVDVQHYDAATMTYSATGGVVTVTTPNTLSAYGPVSFSGFSAGLAPLNGLSFEVSPTGVSNSQFEIVTPLVSGSGSDTGTLIAVDGTITVEANGANWTAGDTVEEEHSAESNRTGMRVSVTNHNTGAASNSYLGWEDMAITATGGGIWGFGFGQSPNYDGGDGAMLTISNQEVASNYQHWNGYLTPPSGILMFGQMDDAVTMFQAPTGGMFYEGCPTSSTSFGGGPPNCSDSTFTNDLWLLEGNGGSNQTTWTPYTLTLNHQGIEDFSNQSSNWGGTITSPSGQMGAIASGPLMNLVPYSNNFNATGWDSPGNFTSVTSNTMDVTDPFGGHNATKVVGTGCGGRCEFNYTLATPLTANTLYQFCFWSYNPNGVLGLAMGAGTGGVGNNSTALWPYICSTNSSGSSFLNVVAILAQAGTFYIYGVSIAPATTPSAGFVLTNGSAVTTPYYGYSPNFPITIGAPTATHCAEWASSTTLEDSGSGCSGPVSNPVTSATGGSGTGTVTCLTASCTNNSGTYSVVGGTFTTGNLLVLVWPTTTTAYKCSVTQNGGATSFGLGHGVATATGMTITNAVTVASATATFDYSCSAQ